MDHTTLALAVIAALSEILPLLGFVKANGFLHGIHSFIVHMHADSECHLAVDVDTVQGPGGADGPATIAALAETPPKPIFLSSI
jgi:hypothetical protein